MLTDYHLHLRPDDDGTDAAAYFTAANAERYLEVASDRGIAELGCAEHVYRFSAALDVWQHPFWRACATDDIDAYAEFLRGSGLKVGIEADYVPGREDRMAALLDAREWDYVVGSVHFLGDEAVDHEGFDIWDHQFVRPEQIWRRYFQTLGEAAASGLFDILAHPDLVKVWGAQRPRPEGDLRYFYEEAMEQIADANIAIEVSTAGLRKPVAELYPDPAFLAMCVDAGCPVALSSDAHVPEHVGQAYDAALELLEQAGVTELAVFDGRERRLEPIG